MDTTNPSGILGTLTEWLSALGAFAFNNIGLTLLLLWCFSLFAMTEFAKPIVRHFLKKKEDSTIVVKAFPQIMGAITGWQVFPSIVSTTKWGGTWSIPGGVGIGAGFLFGLVTIGIYELSKSQKFLKLVKALIRKVMYRVPFLTEEEVDKILATTTGIDTAELHELQSIIEALKNIGELSMAFEEDGSISMVLKIPEPTDTLAT